MASQIETAGKNAILESGVDATCLYLGLIYFDGVSTYTEITGGSYTRQLISWGTASGGVKDLSAPCTFAGLPACTVNHSAIYSASTGGTRLAIDDFTTPRTVVAGDTIQITGFTLTLT